MGFLLDLHPKCLEAGKLLGEVVKRPEVKNDKDYVYWSGLMREKRNQLCSDKEIYAGILKKCKDRIDKILKDLLSQGAYIGLGFRSIDDLEPCIIPSHEWGFLVIDYGENRAHCTGREYARVRFIDAFERLPDDQIELINRAAKGEPQAVALENIDSGENVTSKKSDAEELSISSIMNYWFRYEPKEETQAAINICEDEKERISELLNDAVDTKRLKTRVETKETKTDVFPNEITRKFSTELEDKLYRGYSYTRVDTVKTTHIALNDLTQFLRSINETPPKDSPLMTKWLAKWWPDDEPQVEELVNNGADNRIGTKTKKPPAKLGKQQAAILGVIKANKFEPMAIPDGEKTGTIQRACENDHADLFKGSTSFERAWKKGLETNLWRMEYHESYSRRGNN